MSIRDRERQEIYIAPSGVQKERIKEEDLFVMNMDGDTLRTPKDASLKPSACTPLFFNSYRMRDAGACIHSHSINSVLVTLLCETTPTRDEFHISHLEMIKGIEGHGYESELVVPIIENTPHERDLEASMAAAMRRYPASPCVLVRRHGYYCWAATWQKAKSTAECLEFLFEAYVKMRQLGLDEQLQVPPPSAKRMKAL